MKLTIDFDNKVLTLQETVNLNTLISTIKKMFPDTWKDFTLNTNLTVNYPYPWISYTYGGWTSNSGTILCGNGTTGTINAYKGCTTDTLSTVGTYTVNEDSSYSPTSGVFNVTVE